MAGYLARILAGNTPKLKAAFVFYGSGPESKDDLARIKAPVYGFYAGNDARINATGSEDHQDDERVGEEV